MFVVKPNKISWWSCRGGTPAPLAPAPTPKDARTHTHTHTLTLTLTLTHYTHTHTHIHTHTHTYTHIHTHTHIHIHTYTLTHIQTQRERHTHTHTHTQTHTQTHTHTRTQTHAHKRHLRKQELRTDLSFLALVVRFIFMGYRPIKNLAGHRIGNGSPWAEICLLLVILERVSRVLDGFLQASRRGHHSGGKLGVAEFFILLPLSS